MTENINTNKPDSQPSTPLEPQPDKPLIEQILDWIQSIIDYLFPKKGSGRAA